MFSKNLLSKELKKKKNYFSVYITLINIFPAEKPIIFTV